MKNKVTTKTSQIMEDDNKGEKNLVSKIKII